MSRQNGIDHNVTFVNRFTLEGEPHTFEDAFTRIADFMGKRPGLISYTLSQHADNPKRYVNIARWRSVADLRAAVGHPQFQEHVKELRALARSESDVYVERLGHVSQKPVEL